jgi:hypothetical protein
MNNIRMWFCTDLEMLDRFKICSKLEGFLQDVAHCGNLTEACRAADEPPRLGSLWCQERVGAFHISDEVMMRKTNGGPVTLL